MRIAFFSAFSLQDPASGAAISLRTILERLANQGHEVLAVTGGCFDAPDHPTESRMFTAMAFKQDPSGAWTRQTEALTQVAFETGAVLGRELTRGRIQKLLKNAFPRLVAFQPDVVLSTCSGPAELAMRQELRSRGIPQALYLANPKFKSDEMLQHADVVFCDSQATAKLYQDRFNLTAVPIGKFIEPLHRDLTETPKYATFINPSYEKGVTLFFRIAQMMQQHAPEVVFQVVESRGNLKVVEQNSKLPFSELENIRVIGVQKDIAAALSRTKVLMIPSLWHESGPRVGLEAMSLGIPVVGSNHSGLQENVADGGILIDVPEQMRRENRLIPPPRVALPWVAAIADLMTDAAAYAAASERATAFWKTYAAKDGTALVEATLSGLVVHA